MPRKQIKPLPANMREVDLHRLWSRARKGDLNAQRLLHEMVIQHPRAVTPLIQKFVAQRQSVVQGTYGTPPVAKPQSAWQRAYAKAGRYSVFINGGLPTLGKRK